MDGPGSVAIKTAAAVSGPFTMMRIFKGSQRRRSVCKNGPKESDILGCDTEEETAGGGTSVFCQLTCVGAHG